MRKACAILDQMFHQSPRFWPQVRTTLRVSFRPFEDLRAVSASNRFMAQSALELYLMPANDIFLERLMSDRGPQHSSAFLIALTFKVEFGLKSNGMERCVCVLQGGASSHGLRRTGKGLEDD